MIYSTDSYCVFQRQNIIPYKGVSVDARQRVIEGVAIYLWGDEEYLGELRRIA